MKNHPIRRGYRGAGSRNLHKMTAKKTQKPETATLSVENRVGGSKEEQVARGKWWSAIPLPQKEAEEEVKDDVSRSL